MNTVVLVGRVGRDAEIKYFESGKVKANFSIAVNRRFVKEGSDQKADFLNCIAFGRSAEFIEKYFLTVSKESNLMFRSVLYRTLLISIYYIRRILPGYIRFGLEILLSITILAILTPNLLEIPHKVSPLLTTYKVWFISQLDVGMYRV